MKRIFLFILLISLGFGCGKKSEPEEKKEEHDLVEVVHMKGESQKLVDLQLVSAEKAPLKAALEVVGEIAPETEDVKHVTSPEAGTLLKHLVAIGDTVEKDTPLCSVQPKGKEAIEISSPIHGIVLAQYLKPGDSIDTLTSIMTIANPDLLRASFNVYEKDLAGVKIGQDVSVKSIAYPGKTFPAQIVFVSPSVDEKTRTIKIRVNVKNEEHLLKFGMFVIGRIDVPVSDPVLTVPDEAIQNVKGENVVFVPDAENKEKFLVKKVKIGRKAGEQVEILEGLEEGTKMIGEGSFHLKAELLKGELEEE